jgi:hypothetical protein
MVAKVFHVFHWTKRELERTVAALLEEGVVREVEVAGVAELLISGRVLD